MPTESTVPTDLIFQILCYSEPRDIIRWRTVSKVFYAITRGTALWKTLYRNAAFPRPPGPLSTQTVTSLERTLLKATRLAESWTIRPMRALSSLTINTDKTYTKYLKLISGRWLVVFESDRRLVLHDVDPTAGRHTQVLWEQETPQVSDWDVESIVSSEGHCVVYMLLKLHCYPGWKLLQFQLNYDTGDLLHSVKIDLPQAGSNFSSGVDLYAGNSQLLFISAIQMVFDTRTHIFYQVPSFTEGPNKRLDWIIVSDTSLISLDCLEYKTIVYVFTLLPDSAGGETSLRTLCLTHKDIIYTPVSSVKVMKHAIDPATGATNIRLLNYSPELGPLYLRRVDMILPKCSPGVILPINIEEHNIQLPRERVRPSRYEHYRKYIDISDDGQIRGFLRANKRVRGERPWDTIENQLVMKFTIDTTQDPWVIARGEIGPAEWNNEMDPRIDPTGKYIAFDGMRGRLCYAHPENTIVVADIE